MADDIADFFKHIILKENFCIFIINMPALVQIMACRQTGDEPLCETMVALFTDTDMHHSAPLS